MMACYMLSVCLCSTLRILGPSNGGVGTCIAGVRVLKIGTFEGSGYLGYNNYLDTYTLRYFVSPGHSKSYLFFR